MSAAHGIHVTKDGDARARVVAIVVLGLAAIGIWAPALGSGVFWATPMLVLASWIVARGSLPQTARFQLMVAAALPAWLVIAFLLAGLPTEVFSPGALDTTRVSVGEAVLGLRDGGMGDPWVLAVWLSTSGIAWLVGAMHASRHQRVSAAIGFFMLCIPFATALLFQRAPDAPWHGAVVLAAALLWTTKSELRGSLPAIGGVALVAVLASALIGPSERKFSIDALPGGGASGGLDSRQTYGPNPAGNSNDEMFEVTAQEGSLWRMETLGYFDGRAWFPDPTLRDDLPQPAALPTRTTVRIAGLRDDRVAAPGRVLSALSGAEGARSDNGYRAVFANEPGSGDTYEVNSEVVRPSLSALRDVRVPKGAAFDRYRELAGARPPSGTALTAYADKVAANTPWGEVYHLAADLSEGTDSQLEIVERVQSYLVDSGKFRYSLTDVPDPGSQPLIDFLTSTRVGYCQHFAGAAALLLRLAGVPVRVVAGFATGEPTDNGTYKVRGTDAHAWIEVYFTGFGWVPFDPTPPDTAARVDPSVGITKTVSDTGNAGKGASAGGSNASSTGVALLALVIVGGLAFAFWRRFRVPQAPDPLGEVLVRLVPTPAPPSMTLSELRADLLQLGPTVAALADRAERQRFADPSTPPETRPKRVVLRALLTDIGLWQTVKLLTLGPGRRPVIDEETAAIAANSIAPPPMAMASSAPPPRE